MKRIQILAEMPIGHILLFDHPGGQAPLLGPVERSDSCAVSFVEHGRFYLSQNRQEICFQPGDVLLSYPGTIHRFAHRKECSDDLCLSIQFSCELVKEVVEEDVSGKPKLLASGRTKFLAWQIRQAFDCGESEGIESAVLDTLPALLLEAQQWKALSCRE